MIFRLEDIINAGSDEDLPVYLNRKIVPTNSIALILILAIAIPFIIISLIYFPVLAIIPVLGGLTCTFVIIINYFGGIYYSRLIISVLPLLLAASYNAFLCDANDEPIASVFLTELSFALIPFVVFDLREKLFLTCTSVFCAIIIITFPITKNWVDVNADASVLRFGWLNTVTVCLAIITGFGSMAGLAFLNKQAEKSSEDLLRDMDEKNQVLKESEQVLKENLKKLEESQINEQKRNWASEGLTKISQTLQTNKNKAEIFDNLIAQIVTYVKANQGGIYIVQENENIKDASIKLIACYAYSRKKYIEQEYKAGQGLIGQAFLEKEYIYLTEVPADYLKITSGLGESTPRSILIIPLKINEVVEGIIELASFNKFEAYEINFIEKLGEIIASYILSNKNNEQTQKLLKESTQQAEALRAQEEEMRQNLEELAATQEEVVRKENEYLKEIQRLTDALNKQQPLNDILQQ
jgi:flagellar motility protein MotE (MotC chaperone)